MVGLRFGKRIVLKEVRRKKRNVGQNAYFQVLCDCGKKSVVRGSTLRHDKAASCGCERDKDPHRHAKSAKTQRAKAKNNFWRRFWSKVNLETRSSSQHIPGRCWYWMAGVNRKGYGRFNLSRTTRSAMATHVAFLFANGRFPRGYAMHRCDHPRCVNPFHLFDSSKGLSEQINSYDRDLKAKGAILIDAPAPDLYAIQADSLIDVLQILKKGGALPNARIHIHEVEGHVSIVHDVERSHHLTLHVPWLLLRNRARPSVTQAIRLAAVHVPAHQIVRPPS